MKDMNENQERKNPFFEPYNTPHDVAPFDRIRLEDFEEAMLEGIGVVERHMKKSYTNPKGGKKTIHVGIDLSNLKLVEAAKVEKKAAKKADKKDAKAKKGAK